METLQLPNGRTVWHLPGTRHEVVFIYREIITERVYEREGIEVADGATIVDAGANIGLFTLSILAQHRPARLLCFEPVPDIRACLERNLAEITGHGCEVTISPAALGCIDGQTDITYLPRSPGNSTLFPDEKPGEFEAIAKEQRVDQNIRDMLQLIVNDRRRITCPIMRLSTAIRRNSLERIDLLKIDVEGAELDLLEGIDETDWPIIRQIAMECSVWNKPRLPALVAELRSRGFSNVSLVAHSNGGAPLEDGNPCMLYARR
jgi:FkbM family methyltransferase